MSVTNRERNKKNNTYTLIVSMTEGQSINSLCPLLKSTRTGHLFSFESDETDALHPRYARQHRSYGLKSGRDMNDQNLAHDIHIHSEFQIATFHQDSCPHLSSSNKCPETRRVSSSCPGNDEFVFVIAAKSILKHCRNADTSTIRARKFRIPTRIRSVVNSRYAATTGVLDIQSAPLSNFPVSSS